MKLLFSIVEDFILHLIYLATLLTITLNKAKARYGLMGKTLSHAIWGQKTLKGLDNVNKWLSPWGRCGAAVKLQHVMQNVPTDFGI